MAKRGMHYGVSMLQETEAYPSVASEGSEGEPRV